MRKKPTPCVTRQRHGTQSSAAQKNRGQIVSAMPWIAWLCLNGAPPCGTTPTVVAPTANGITLTFAKRNMMEDVVDHCCGLACGLSEQRKIVRAALYTVCFRKFRQAWLRGCGSAERVANFVPLGPKVSYPCVQAHRCQDQGHFSHDHVQNRVPSPQAKCIVQHTEGVAEDG